MERSKNGVVRWKKVVTQVEDHLIVPVFPSGLSRESYDEYLREYQSKISREKFSEDKPLWEVHLIKYPSLNGASTLICKVSHAIGDGYSLVSMFLKGCQRADDPSLPLTFPQLSLKRQGDDGKCTVIGMGKKMLGFMGTSTCLEDQPSAIRKEASTDMKTKLFRPFNIYSVTLSLEKVKQVKTKLGATVNDVITGLLSYTIHLYALRKTGMDQYSKDGSTTDSNSGGANTNMTLAAMRAFEGFANIEDMIRADAWGNRSRSMFIKLPTFTNLEKVNPLDFIVKAKETMDRKKNSMMFYFIDKLLNTALWIWGQKGMEKLVYSSFKNARTMISSVIGPKEKMALYNHPINSFYFFTSGIPQSVAFFSVSYMEQLRLVVTMEKGFIDSKKFSSCVDAAFDDIFQAAFENSQDKDYTVTKART
ncbi:hypothetical protein MKW98_011574 [Papaver atlanticum]|uniref:Diacylglycerol O-acyltransferase n=1 Tax=Papaver atlanticum TaxID=357466 RepID=A0AAD4S851_9MAGN|nr:hypothetical protein MKW98_011574 [Papaver atlanticum]